ncbi:hypothetical protein L227DRAFT_428190 [Lentinus tigrinus ALCF2SS1-6]|uniref:Uncharacterized protein n=1 Tax=Lentinus tigrinus ALCF2SS1-6 TaxID=1328759 RepID=A0A5C2RQQ5_9APHY|nr:hypothetical protein L227DRAFT_428190 [Lentinus tigrinus ALCF2SS1-6]
MLLGSFSDLDTSPCYSGRHGRWKMSPAGSNRQECQAYALMSFSCFLICSSTLSRRPPVPSPRRNATVGFHGFLSMVPGAARWRPCLGETSHRRYACRKRHVFRPTLGHREGVQTTSALWSWLILGAREPMASMFQPDLLIAI